MMTKTNGEDSESHLYENTYQKVMTRTNGEDSESHLYKNPLQKDGSANMNENTCHEVLMTKTHQEEGKANVYETPYQTGIVMNDTYRQEMKDKDHPAEIDEAEDQNLTARLRDPQDEDQGDPHQEARRDRHRLGAEGGGGHS